MHPFSASASSQRKRFLQRFAQRPPAQRSRAPWRATAARNGRMYCATVVTVAGTRPPRTRRQGPARRCNRIAIVAVLPVLRFQCCSIATIGAPPRPARRCDCNTGIIIVIAAILLLLRNHRHRRHHDHDHDHHHHQHDNDILELIMGHVPAKAGLCDGTTAAVSLRTARRPSECAKDNHHHHHHHHHIIIIIIIIIVL